MTAPTLKDLLADGTAGIPREMFSGRTRDRLCPRCSKPFVQHELSKSMQKWVEALPPGARREWDETVSDNALPLLCVPCERKDLNGSSPAPERQRYGVGYGE